MSVHRPEEKDFRALGPVELRYICPGEIYANVAALLFGQHGNSLESGPE